MWALIDDFSRYTRVYLLRTKDEVEEMFLKYKVEVENQLDRKIKRIRSDRRGEYITIYLKEFCENNGFEHELVPLTLPNIMVRYRYDEFYACEL